MHFSVSLHSVPVPRFPECRTLRHRAEGVCALHSNWGGGRGVERGGVEYRTRYFSSDMSYIMFKKETNNSSHKLRDRGACFLDCLVQ